MSLPCYYNVYITVEAATLIGLTFVAATSIVYKSMMARKKKSGNAAKSPPPQPPPAPVKAAIEPTKVVDLAGPVQSEASVTTVATVPMIEEADSRPETSPYASPPCTVPFASPMTVPRDILIKSPKLHAAFEDNLPELPEIPEDIGHVLVHYLHTGAYGALKPREPFIPSKQIVELRTSIRAYAAARAYDLPDLMRLAQLQIEKFGEGLPLPSLLEITRDAFPTLSEHDDWFLDYLKSRIRPHLEDPKSILGSDLLDRISGILSPHKVLLRTVLEMFCERIMPRAALTNDMATLDSTKPNSPPPPSSPMSMLQMRSRAIMREETLPARKQTPWPSPDPELASIASSEQKAEPTVGHLELHAPETDHAHTTEFKIEAEPVLNEEDETPWRTAVMPVGHVRQDSGKLFNVEPEFGVGPVYKELDPIPEPSTPEAERPGKRVLREVDSGFWEFSPAELERVKDRAPSVVEILPEPARDLEPVQEMETPEHKQRDDLVDTRDFAAPEANEWENVKPTDVELEAPESLEPVPVPPPTPFTETDLQLSDKSPETVLETTPEQTETVGPEVMSDTSKSQATRTEPDHEEEVQPQPKTETPAKPELLSHDAEPVESSEPKTAEPRVEPEPEPAREPEIQATEPLSAAEPAADTATKPAVSSAEPAPQQEGTKASPESPADCGNPARQRSWKRKLSLRYPVLFGRGM
ncbi:hypothetical protein B0H66DRAFT_107549 [Apodospora peruviana]|uniref:Uncharacterized protein n=1 Tax=Apodospora peruviana TaxID=516989 RepID=A0AAE0IHB7_9PEZI|nr:hypothetical protein B0H66DRAFT_107549 [Apodospora peruviana]